MYAGSGLPSITCLRTRVHSAGPFALSETSLGFHVAASTASRLGLGPRFAAGAPSRIANPGPYGGDEFRPP